MKPKHHANKHISIHAHFYQPPRENPWTNEVDFQPSAYPFENWNQRIARECYIPNLYAPIKDENNKVIETINNYEFLNFNFGPTLLSWLEKEYPYYYKKIIASVQKSHKETGHLNAIAQIYNHVIMPLASFNDQLTQLLWGINDFKYRFGFEPESVWLPETAANKETLKLLIDQKIKYIILAPHQAEKIRLLDTKKWTDVSKENIDPKKPYFWHDKDEEGKNITNRKIAVFFYDAGLSKAVAFENIMDHSSVFADRALACYDDKTKEDQLLLIASDGETYGHHQKFSDMTLAHSFKHEFKNRSIKTVNLASYLETHQPKYEVEIKKGPDGEGTSWSCAHGVRRWKGGCDCGKERNILHWRAPLRASLNWLRDVLIEIYKQEGEKLFKDVWEARNNYIKPLITLPQTGDKLSSHKKTLNEFLAFNLKENLTKEDINKALNLLEMQKYAMYMFTSCGWFFSDISRIEAVQNLKYAAKAIEIAGKLGFKDIEKGFLSLLELAPSNHPEFKTGADIYKNLVTSNKLPIELAIYGHLIELFHFSATEELHFKYFYEMEIKKLKTNDLDRLKLTSGILKSKNTITKEYHEHAFAYFSEKKEMPFICLTSNDADNKLEIMRKTFSSMENINKEKAITEIEKIFSEKIISFKELPFNEKTNIIKKIVRSIKSANSKEAFKIFKSYMGLFEKNRDLGSILFSGLKEEIRSYSKEVIEILIDNYIRTKNSDILNELRLTAQKIKLHKIEPDTIGQENPLIKEIFKDFSNASAGAQESVDKLLEIDKIAQCLSYNNVLFHIYNVLSDINIKTRQQGD
ncbi:MAG: DUF3536 domain-containing protein [Elusimicrobia bacterium]|nr:DUF3536 domain-containing protein [Elusimicrobiota bacterium]